MNDIYEEIKEHYFAAANSSDGFVGYFDEIFRNEENNRIFILKGGPGVGKSTFMKKVCERATQLGKTCECFHCSSDPDSLDGVAIKDMNVCVIDGTSPHTFEARLAGAREIIIDLGRAWDIVKLSKDSSLISQISQKKSSHYKDCYKYLYCKRVMDDLNSNLVSPYILFDKMKKSCDRLSRELFKNSRKENDVTRKIRLTSAISTKGFVRFSSFEDMAEFCVFLKEPFENFPVCPLFLAHLLNNASKMGISALVSFSPFAKNKIDALYFPQIKICVSMYRDELAERCDRTQRRCKIVNCARFIDAKSFSRLKSLRKFYSRLSRTMLSLALESLSNAGKMHEKLEEIYAKSTDYEIVAQISEEYLEKIF